MPARTNLRRKLGFVAVALFLVFSCFFQPPSAAAQAEYKTLMAFGSVIPIGTDQAENVPLIYIRYRDRFKKPTFQIDLVTGSLTAYYRPQDSELDWEGIFTGKILVHGSTGSIYSQGTWAENKSMYAHSSLQMMKLHYNLDGDQDISVALGTRYHVFERSKVTQLGMVLPHNFIDLIGNLEWHGDWGDWHKFEPHYIAEIKFESRERKSWQAWDLEAATRPTSPRFVEGTFSWNQKWQNDQKSEVLLEVSAGKGLDFFSAFRIGGLGGSHQLPGYYRDEFRAKRFALTKAMHSWVVKDGPTFGLYTSYASWDLVGLPYQALDAPRSAGLSVGFELFYPIERLKGLPVVLIYGKGLNPPLNSPSPFRNELLLGLVAAF